jgi:Flp pilus assembly pilin Flp
VKLKVIGNEDEKSLAAGSAAYQNQEKTRGLVEQLLLLCFVVLTAIAYIWSVGANLQAIWSGINTRLTAASRSTVP